MPGFFGWITASTAKSSNPTPTPAAPTTTTTATPISIPIRTPTSPPRTDPTRDAQTEEAELLVDSSLEHWLVNVENVLMISYPEVHVVDRQAIIVKQIVDKFKNRQDPPAQHFYKIADCSSGWLHKINKETFNWGGDEVSNFNQHLRASVLMHFLGTHDGDTDRCDDSQIKKCMDDTRTMATKNEKFVSRQIMRLNAHLKTKVQLFMNIPSSAEMRAQMESRLSSNDQRVMALQMDMNDSSARSAADIAKLRFDCDHIIRESEELRTQISNIEDQRMRQYESVTDQFNTLQNQQTATGLTVVGQGQAIDILQNQQTTTAQIVEGQVQAIAILEERANKIECKLFWSNTSTALMLKYIEAQQSLLFDIGPMEKALENAFDAYKRTIIDQSNDDAATLASIKGIFDSLAEQVPDPFKGPVKLILKNTIHLLNTETEKQIFPNDVYSSTETDEPRARVRTAFAELKKNLTECERKADLAIIALKTVGPTQSAYVTTFNQYYALLQQYINLIRAYNEYSMKMKINMAFGGTADQKEELFKKFWDDNKGHEKTEEEMKGLINQKKDELLKTIVFKENTPKKNLTFNDLQQLFELDLYCRYITNCCVGKEKQTSIGKVGNLIFWGVPPEIIKKLRTITINGQNTKILGIIDSAAVTQDERKLTGRGKIKFLDDDDHRKSLVWLCTWINENLSPFTIYTLDIEIQKVIDYRTAYIDRLNHSIRSTRVDRGYLDWSSTRRKIWVWTSIQPLLERRVEEQEFKKLKPFKTIEELNAEVAQDTIRTSISGPNQMRG
jgi:hypothetical protein